MRCGSGRLQRRAIMSDMLRSVIFDCNGVIADDEGIHYLLFRKVLEEEEGIELGREEYDAKYLWFDDRHCFAAVLEDRGRRARPGRVAELVERKAAYYRAVVPGHLRIFPGVKELVRALAERYPLAVASGARREEIRYILGEAGLGSYFRVIVGSEDVERAKPDPEPFLAALDRLNAARRGKDEPIHPAQCLVIEDSVGGVAGARAAGMRCLAVTHTYPAAALSAADQVVASLEGVTPASLEALFLR